jgi:hypothetical protein
MLISRYPPALNLCVSVTFRPLDPKTVAAPAFRSFQPVRKPLPVDEAAQAGDWQKQFAKLRVLFLSRLRERHGGGGTKPGKSGPLARPSLAFCCQSARSSRAGIMPRCLMPKSLYSWPN